MTENTNPGNFANRPKEEVQAIASKGGKASGGGGHTDSSTSTNISSSGSKTSSSDSSDVTTEGRDEQGRFTKGSEAAKEAGHKGGAK